MWSTGADADLFPRGGSVVDSGGSCRFPKFVSVACRNSRSFCRWVESATNSDHVVDESRLELDRLWLADSTPMLFGSRRSRCGFAAKTARKRGAMYPIPCSATGVAERRWWMSCQPSSRIGHRLPRCSIGRAAYVGRVGGRISGAVPLVNPEASARVTGKSPRGVGFGGWGWSRRTCWGVSLPALGWAIA